jgi:excisionase family DNA binding protein
MKEGREMSKIELNLKENDTSIGLLKRLLSVRELGIYLGVSTVTIYRWTRKKFNGLPTHRLGGLLRFDLAEVNRWVSDNRQ